MGSPSRNQKQSLKSKISAKKGKDESLSPLSKKTFYLDVKGFKGVELLSFDIRLLGGSIENFLSKEISCVITNRSDGKHGEPSLIGNVASPLISTPSSLSARSCTNFDSPNTFESPGDDRQKKFIKSRGEALLEKAMKSGVRGTSDVLQNARKWGVQVIALPKFLDWLSKYKATHNIQKEFTKDSKKGKTSGTSATVIKLYEPYVKLEAVNRLYKPIYKQLQSWPELNVMVPSYSSPFTVLARKEKNRKQKQSKMCVPETPVTSESESEFSDSFQNKKKLSLTINELYRSSGYCEICTVSYNDLDKHLQSTEHKAFVQNRSNYTSLDKLISDGNSISSFINSSNSSTLESNTNEDEVNLLSPMHCFSNVRKNETKGRNERKRNAAAVKKVEYLDAESEPLSKRNKNANVAMVCNNDSEESASVLHTKIELQQLEVDESLLPLPQVIECSNMNDFNDVTENNIQMETTPVSSKHVMTPSSSDSLVLVGVNWKSPKLLSPLKCEMETKPFSSIDNENSKLLPVEVLSTSPGVQPLNLSKDSILKASLTSVNDQNDSVVFSPQDSQPLQELHRITKIMSKCLSPACLSDYAPAQESLDVDKENAPPVPLDNKSPHLLADNNSLVDINVDESVNFNNQNLQITNTAEIQIHDLNMKTINNEVESLHSHNSEKQLEDSVTEDTKSPNIEASKIPNQQLQASFNLSPSLSASNDDSWLNSLHNIVDGVVRSKEHSITTVDNSVNNNCNVLVNSCFKEIENKIAKNFVELQNGQEDQLQNCETELQLSQYSNCNSSLPQKEVTVVGSEEEMRKPNKENLPKSKQSNSAFEQQINCADNCKDNEIVYNFEIKDDIATECNVQIAVQDIGENELNNSLPIKGDESVRTVKPPEFDVDEDNDIRTVSNNHTVESHLMLDSNITIPNYASKTTAVMYPSYMLGMQNLMMDTARFHQSIYSSMGIDICNVKPSSSELKGQQLGVPQFDYLPGFTDFRISSNSYTGDLNQNCLLNVEKWIQSFQPNQQSSCSNTCDYTLTEESCNQFPSANTYKECGNVEGKLISNNSYNAGKQLVLTNNSMQKLFNSELDSSEFSGFCSDVTIPLPVDLSYTTEALSSYPCPEDLIDIHENHEDQSSEFSVHIVPSSENMEWDKHVDTYITKNVVNKEPSSYKYSGESEYRFADFNE